MLLFARTVLVALALFAPHQVAASPSEEAIEAVVAKMLGNMTMAQKARQLVYVIALTSRDSLTHHQHHPTRTRALHLSLLEFSMAP